MGLAVFGAGTAGRFGGTNAQCGAYGAPAAIQYLKGRGLTGEIAAQFGLGYAPDDWQGLEPVFGSYRDDAIAGPLIEAGLLIESEKRDADGKPRRYDRFRDRIMFPIRNTKGQVIGFGGRVMGQGEPKYLNSPETPLFSKGAELYGLFEARHAIRETGYVLVVEGYMDVVALAQLGFANAVATLGTACTPVHVQKLLRQTDAVVFSFDGDAAGDGREVDGGVFVLGDDDDAWLVGGGEDIVDGGGVVDTSSGIAVGGVEVGEVNPCRVSREESEAVAAG